MKASKLEGILEQVKQDLNKPVAEHTLKKEMKMATKVKKGKGKAKAEAKPEKKSKGKSEASDANMVTLADLAEEAGISGATARRKIRATEMEREGRWSWEKGSKQLRTAREALGLKAA